jgi:ferrochelatase
MNEQSVTGVLLLNLGGPEKQDDVEPFLYNLFSDRSIIRLGPFFMQKFIARKIARKRAPSSKANYEKIGGGSPILEITNRQAQALEKTLNTEGRFLVRPCMRYWQPFASEVLAEMAQGGIDRLIALPLYPHYSIATTGSSLADLESVLKKTKNSMVADAIKSWPCQPEYIECLCTRIRAGIDRFAGEEVELVYSAHSLPKKFIDEGDPYVREIQQTIAAIGEKTGIKGKLCYQSRSGPVEWLGPSTPDMLKTLADKGCRNILMVPIAFVSDHIETLYEIDMLYKDMASDLGMRLESTPGLNDDPLFIEGLKKLVLQKMGKG